MKVECNICYERGGGVVFLLAFQHDDFIGYFINLVPIIVIIIFLWYSTELWQLPYFWYLSYKVS